MTFPFGFGADDVLAGHALALEGVGAADPAADRHDAGHLCRSPPWPAVSGPLVSAAGVGRCPCRSATGAR